MVFLVLGMALGMTTAILHLVQLGASIEQKGPSHKRADTQSEKTSSEGAPGPSTQTQGRTGHRPNGT